MNGYLDGDGHYDSKNNRWRIGFTNNDYLASDLRVISARLGYALSLRRSKHRCQTGVFDGYRGELRKTRNGDHHSSRPLGEVVAIRNSRAREFWDIEVADEPHTFALASGILSHNCKPSCLPESMKGWRWERCRVKVKSRRGENNPHPSKTGGVNYQGDGGASWQLCPGCSKCTPNDGWILRRGSGRCTNSYEYIFVMAKSSEYFWNSAEFVEEAVSKIGERNRTSTFNKQGDVGNHHQGADKILDTGFKNPRSVWTISSEPSKKKHWASYPSEIPRRAITAGTSSGGCCPQCRSPYAPMVVSEQLKRERPNDRTDRHDAGDGVNSCGNTVAGVKTNITGYRPSCSCGVATPVPCAVLDIFAGTGTTAQVAQWMGRDWLLTELYDQYIEICKEKIFSTPPRCSIKKAAKKGRQQKETATKPVCPPTRRPTRDNRVPLPGQKELL